jgi:autotransporter-associated beta strand protein
LVVAGATGTTDKPVLRLNSVNAISSGSTISGATSTDRVGTLDFNAGTAYTLNSYSGGTMNFTNSFGQDSVVTFTNAANILTSSAGGTGGRSLQNNSANLDIVFNGSLDIGSSVTDTVNTIGGAGDFVVKGNIFSTTAGSVRGLNKTGAGLLEMRGDNNSYNGNTTIFNGTISVTNGAVLTGTTVRVAPSSGNSGTLLVNGATGAVVVSARGIVRGGGSITSLQVQDAGTVEVAVGTTWTTGGTIDFAAGSKVLVTGTPTEASYTLVSASGGITGTPVLETAIPGYVLAVEGNSLVLRQQVAKLTPTIIVTPSVGGYVYSGSTQGPGFNEVNKGGSTGGLTLSYAGTGSTTYGPSDIPPINAGTYTLTATVASDSSYNEASSTPTAFTIGKATPTVTVAPTASPVTVGALLSSSILSGGAASVAGTYAWTTPSTVLSASGPYPVTFNPTDSANYNTASTSASVTANPAGTTYSGWLSGGTASDAAFLDYVFGATAPGALDSSLKPTVAVTSGNLVLTYNVRQGTLGLTVTAQTSADLATGAAGWGTGGVTDVAVGTPRNVNGVSVQQRTASVSASGGKKFLRIQAVQAAP